MVEPGISRSEVLVGERPRLPAARPELVLSWLVPLGVLAVALVWLLPLAVQTPAAQGLRSVAIGNGVVLAILLVWATSLAVVSSLLLRSGRAVGRSWVVVQVALLIALIVWALPPLLLAMPASVEDPASWVAHSVLPVVALALCVLQAVLLFLRA